MIALLGLFLIVITGTIDWDDVLAEKSAWDTLIWFGALVMLASQLNEQGVIAWFSGLIQSGLDALGLGWFAAAALLVLLFLYSHYFFASTTAHITAMMLAFLSVGVAIVPETALSEEAYRANSDAAHRRIREIATDTSAIHAVCSQGKVIPPLMQWWAHEDDLTLPVKRNRKGSVWVLSTSNGRLLAADHIDSPLPHTDRQG